MDTEQDRQDAPQQEPDQQAQEPTSAPTPDPVQQALEAARESAARAREEAQRWYQVASQQVPEPDAAPEEEENIDPDIQKAIDRRVQQTRQELASAYQQERQQDLSYRARLERKQAAAELPNWRRYEREIDEYMQNVPVHVRAAEGAYREAYYAVVGRHMTEESIAAQSRAPQVVSSGRSPGEPEPRPSVDEAQQAFVQNAFGFDLSDKEFEALNRKTVTIDEFDALMEKK
jgi:hypothetical protein